MALTPKPSRGGTHSVLGLAPSYSLRPDNTDWRHMKLLQSVFAEGRYGWTFGLRDSLRFNVRENASLLNGIVFRRLFKARLSSSYFTRLGPHEYQGRHDVVYAYGNFPAGSRMPPVLWHDGPTNPDSLRRRGFSEDEIAAEIRIKGECVANAAVVAVSSDHAQREMCRLYPGFDAKFEVLPFLLPYVQALTVDRVAEKHGAAVFDILFVGRQARRKGLDLLLAAFAELRRRAPQIHLTIVSEFADGPVALPDCGGIDVLGNQPVEKVQQLMRTAHIYAMPSREETYGIVYVEAMAAGAVCLAPDREPQRSLLEGGRAGSLVALDPASIAAELQRLVSDPRYRVNKALFALETFAAKYSLAAVSAAYARAFERTRTAGT